MNEQDLFTLHDYLEGTLPEAESKRVAERIAKDAAWAKAYEEEKLLVDMATAHSVQQLRTRLDRIHAEVAEPPATDEGKQHFLNWRPLAVAASLLLPLAAGLLWWSTSQSTSVSEQLAVAYVPTEHLPAARRGESELTTLERVNQAFLVQAYAQAAEGLDTVNTLSLEYQVVLGICYLEMAHWTEAEQALRPLLNDPNLGPRAQWYLAVTYLKQDQWDQARQLLTNLAASEGAGMNLRDKAKALLESL